MTEQEAHEEQEASAEKEEEPFVLEPLTEEEITVLARRIVTNEVYVAWEPEALDMSFGMFMMLAGGSQAMPWIKDVGLVYEEWSKANERSVNGYPTFFSARFVHKDSRNAVQREALRMAVALGAVEQAVLDKFDQDEADYLAAKDKEEISEHSSED